MWKDRSAVDCDVCAARGACRKVAVIAKGLFSMNAMALDPSSIVCLIFGQLLVMQTEYEEV